MDSGSLPGGLAHTSTEQARSSRVIANVKRPEWPTFPPEHIAMFLACIAEIELAGCPRLQTYNLRLLTSMKRILTSQWPVRF